MNKKFFSTLIPAALLVSATVARTQPPPPPAAGPVGPVFIVEYRTDMPGSDLRPGFPVGDLGQCMNACVEDPGCRAFTWVKPYEQPPRRDNASPLCWLKNSAPNKMMHPGMISGIRQ